MRTIAFFIPDLGAGGAEKSILRLLPVFLLQGDAVDLVVTRAEGVYLPDIPEGVNLVELHSKRVLFALVPLVRYLRKNKPAVLIAHLRHANLVALLASKIARTDTKIIAVEHAVLTGAGKLRGRERVLPWLMKILYPSADALVAVSEGAARGLEQGLGLRRGRVRSIYNPVVDRELAILSAVPPVHPWLVAKEGPVFLAIGRLSPEKDFKSLLKAFRIVRDRLYEERGVPVRLLILGEGKERPILEEEVVSLGLEKDVSFPGFVKNPYNYLSHADAFVLSSRYEGLSNVLIEALACGCPVVATDCPGGPAEILRNGKFGMLVAVGNVPALAEAMIRVVEAVGTIGEEVREEGTSHSEMSARGVLRAAEFSTERSAAAYLSLVNEIQRDRRPLVLHIIAGLEPGGAEIMLCNLVSRMNRHAVLSLSGKLDLAARLVERGVEVYHLGMAPGTLPFPGTIIRFIRLLRHIRPHTIQGWMYHGNLAALFVRSWLPGRPPVIWGIHHSIAHLEKEKTMTRAMIRLGARFSKGVDRIVYVSEVSRRQHAAIGYSEVHALTIPNAVDTTRFRPDPGEGLPGLRVSLLKTPGPGMPDSGVPDSDEPGGIVLIGLFARYHPVKDHANFLRAAAWLCKQGTRAHFVLAGRGIDTGNKELTDLVNELGISGHVHFLGERNDIERLLPALDIFCLSSYGEALPLILLEAMSCGLPCVTTDVGDAAAVVGETGLSVPSGDYEALGVALESLVKAGGVRRKELGGAARERVIRYYSLETVAGMYADVYGSFGRV